MDFDTKKRNGNKGKCWSLLLILPALYFAVTTCYSADFPLEKWGKDSLDSPFLIGGMKTYFLKNKETLLDIARRFDLGYNEISLYYKGVDPWLPPRGRVYLVPTLWIVPPSKYKQIIINIPELRLYYFYKKEKRIYTFPLGIGDEGWETPIGTARIIEKRKHPTWHIPKSLWDKYKVKSIPPGPENPLGDYWMGLSIRGYGIHGTNSPWGVGRLVSHGCIRLYPEDIEVLFYRVPIGTRVEIIYEPVKVCKSDTHVYMEVHPDVYDKIPDLKHYALQKLEDMGLLHLIDAKLFNLVIKEQNGVPARISRSIDEDNHKDVSLQPTASFFKNDTDL